jgi:hypothetical protein
MGGTCPPPLETRCFPHPRHSRYQPPSGLRSRCQRCRPMRHSQGLVIAASLEVSRSGSVKAIQRVQMRESTPLLLLAYRDPRLLPAISPGRSREASPGLTRQRRRRPGRRASRTGSRLDQRCDGAGRRRSMPSVPLRRVRAGEVRCEELLYTLKAGPAGGRQHSTSTPLIIHGGAHRNKT